MAGTGSTASQQVNSTNKCNIIAIPYPGRGHINPMMNFCKLIASSPPAPNNFLITFVVTEEWHQLLSLSCDPMPGNIRFGIIPNILPSETSRGKNFSAFVEALLTKMEPLVESFLDRMAIPNPTVIISDSYLRWALKIGKRRNIPVASFWTTSATMFSICHHYDLMLQNGHFEVNPLERGEELVNYIPGMAPICIADLPPQFHGKRPQIVPITLDIVAAVPAEANYLLLTSYSELETSVIDNLKANLPIPTYSIGPSLPYWTLKDNSSLTSTFKDVPNYFDWLNAQPRFSVLYISLGSFISVSNEQMDEIAAGVVDSGVRFFWVVREDVSRLQEGSGGKKGLVVPWCDQLKVLCHPSIGGFWSHCGWNSTKEGAFAGTPMLTFPLQWDQYPNAKHIVDDWKMGRRLKGTDDDFITREEISGVLKRFMDLDCEEGKEIRRRAQEVRKICERTTAEGGSSELEIEAFINDITSSHTH